MKLHYVTKTGAWDVVQLINFSPPPLAVAMEIVFLLQDTFLQKVCIILLVLLVYYHYFGYISFPYQCYIVMVFYKVHTRAYKEKQKENVMSDSYLCPIMF